MFSLQSSGAAASWVVGRMGTDAHLYDDPDDASIPALLDSRFDADKVDALKRLLALIAQGVDVAHLFPQVAFPLSLLRLFLFLLLSLLNSIHPRPSDRSYLHTGRQERRVAVARGQEACLPLPPTLRRQVCHASNDH